MALADIGNDLAAVMARELTSSDLVRAERLLEIASQKVQTFTGQTFTREETTDRLPVRNGKVRLPQRPVIDVSAVTDIDGNTVEFDWDGSGVIDLTASPLSWFEREPRRTKLRTVQVTYEHGYDTIPADVVGVVCDMVAAALDFPPEQIGLQSETVGPASVTYGTQFAGGVRLTPTMRETLAPYRAPVGTANVS